MVTNERQYRITKSEARKFEQAIEAARGHEPNPDVDPLIHQAMIEALKAGKVKSGKARSLRELPIVLIEGRIAAGLTQREFAKRLGVPEQQIQRYEATLYAGVSLERLQEVADTLGLEIEERVKYAVPA
jgi:DNA-binding XRE family transcriptional regulator